MKPVLVALVATLLLAGCTGGPLGGDRPSETVSIVRGENGVVGGDYPRGVHPYPNGTEWPTGLEGPFEREAPISVVVQGAGGIGLHGWIHLPKLPEGVLAPTVLWSSPYFGQTQLPGNDPSYDTDPVVPVGLLVSSGYAVAMFNVRGTGPSEGCFEFFGPNEQKDQAILVEWIARQYWSNGRVGMMGLSYHGTTPWEAAINNPPSLKTIVVAGMVSDLYTFFHTPQGAIFTVGAPFYGLVTGLVSLAPTSDVVGQSGMFRGAPSVPGRVCPELAEAIATTAAGTFTDLRDQQFWSDRNLINKFPDVTTSVFLTHGFQDNHGSGHQQQEDHAWNALTQAPKRMLEGQWGHEFPNTNSFRSEFVMTDWFDRLMPWLDFWLKGIGPAPPFVGTMDYQDGTGSWYQTTSWPPADVREEVLYLNDGRLDSAPPSGPMMFRSTPAPTGPDGVLCPGASDEAATRGLVFETPADAGRFVLAGNPYAYLPLTSDLPGGLVGVHVYRLGKEYSCGEGGPQGHRLLVAGVADLRFHGGNIVGKDFPTNARTAVRVDVSSLAEVIEDGERLAVVVSYGDPADRTGAPLYPEVTLVPASDGDAPHIVLPFVSGSLGGAAPALAYPDRPFLPAGINS